VRERRAAGGDAEQLPAPEAAAEQKSGQAGSSLAAGRRATISSNASTVAIGKSPTA